MIALVLALTSAIVVILITVLAMMLRMPGAEFRTELLELTHDQQQLANQLKEDVVRLTLNGPRTTRTAFGLQQAALFIEKELGSAGCHVARQTFLVADVKMHCANVEGELLGTIRPEEIIVIGAHYDSAGNLGADDNASGVAVLLALARRFAKCESARTLRFVAFANEEPPYMYTKEMGSYVYAERSHKRGDNIVAMLNLESVGYYSSVPGRQRYPIALRYLFPPTGNFIAFVGNSRSRALVHRCIATFRSTTPFPSQGIAAPTLVPGISWSDQWSFWQFGWPALMATDTAPFRNPNYHRPSDTWETLDYECTARVTDGLAAVILDLSSEADHH